MKKNITEEQIKKIVANSVRSVLKETNEGFIPNSKSFNMDNLNEVMKMMKEVVSSYKEMGNVLKTKDMNLQEKYYQKLGFSLKGLINLIQKEIGVR